MRGTEGLLIGLLWLLLMLVCETTCSWCTAADIVGVGIGRERVSLKREAWRELPEELIQRTPLEELRINDLLLLLIVEHLLKLLLLRVEIRNQIKVVEGLEICGLFLWQHLWLSLAYLLLACLSLVLKTFSQRLLVLWLDLVRPHLWRCSLLFLFLQTLFSTRRSISTLLLHLERLFVLKRYLMMTLL